MSASTKEQEGVSLQIQGSRHRFCVVGDDVQIDGLTYPLLYWFSHLREIGTHHGYTDSDIKEMLGFLRFVADRQRAEQQRLYAAGVKRLFPTAADA